MTYTTDDDRYGRPSSPSGPDSWLGVWRRRRGGAMLTFVAVVAAGFTMALALPDLYRATATVLIEREQVSEEFVRPSVTAELETRIQTVHRQVTSRAALQRVIETLNLYPELRRVLPMDALADRMRQDIQFGPTGVDQSTGGHATIAFTISYQGRDPEKAALVANTLARLYAEGNTANRSQQASQTAEFLKKQLSDVELELQRQEQRSNSFNQRHSGELAEQVEVNLATLDRLNNQLRLNGEQKMRAVERRERLERERIEAESAAQPGPLADSPVTRLVRARQELAELQRKYSDQYPDVVRAQAEVATLEKQTVAPDPTIKLTRQAIEEVDTQLASLDAEEQSLRRAIAGYQDRIENAPRLQQSMQQLARDYQISSERYQAVLKRYEEAQLAETLEEGQRVERFQILDAAVVPTHPAAPNRDWLFVMTIIAAVATAIGVIAIREKLDSTVHSLEQLRELTDAPTLASIPLIQTAQGARRRWLRRAVATVAVAIGMSAIVAGAYYVSAGNEQIVRLTSRPGV
jgi:polysaccharide chain length determinant protein (PEP-CTERM system associated)